MRVGGDIGGSFGDRTSEGKSDLLALRLLNSLKRFLATKALKIRKLLALAMLHVESAS